MTDKPNQRTSYPLRMPDDLRQLLELAAEHAGRSLHAEIVRRLQQSVADPSLDSASEDMSDEARYMSAVRYLMEYGKKYDFDISVQLTRQPEKMLAIAIKNGSLPADATLEDLSNPGPAVARMMAAKNAAKGVPADGSLPPAQPPKRPARARKTNP